jgi:hypothetical protein
VSSDSYSLDAALDHFQRIKTLNPSRDWRLTVSVRNVGGLTAHQTVEVKSIGAGFDWTAGQVLIEPARPLTWLTPEQVEDITKSVRAGGSWHAYEREKKLRAKIASLEAEAAALREELQKAKGE